MRSICDLKKIVFSVCFLCCLCGAFAVSTGPGPLQGAVKALDDNERVITGADFENAVKQAGPGDTLSVSGEIILSRSITLGKNLTIKKAETAETAVFKLSEEPSNKGRHFIIADKTEAAFINIGFKGHGGLRYSDESDHPFGGGIEVGRKSKLTLAGCSFWGIHNRIGGAVGMEYGGSITIDKCSFTYNRATYKGGAVYACGLPPDYEDEDDEDSFEDGGAADPGAANTKFLGLVTVTDSVIENNWAEYGGGGLAFDDFSEGEVRSCVINNNRITRKGDIYSDGGGGIAVGTAKISVFGSVISNNEAQNGGGLHFESQDYPGKQASVIADCVIYKNTAYGNGGGIFAFRKSAILLYGCSVYENVSERGGGACIGEKGDSVYGTEADAVFVFCTVALNRSSLEGGGIYATESFTSVYGSVIAGNSEAAGAYPKTFTADDASIYSDGYEDIFTVNLSEHGQIKIKPYGPAHNKIPRDDVIEWLKNGALAPLTEIISQRVMYGGAYDTGASELPEYTAAFISEGNNYIPPKVYCEGELPAMPQQPEKEGYIFKGWYTDPDFETAYETLPLTDDLTLYAKWEKLPPPPFPWAIVLSISGGAILFAGLFAAAYITIYKKRILKLAQGVNILNVNEVSYPELDALTPREREVFKLLIKGNTLRQIQGELKTAYETVHFHYKNIYKKLKVNSRIELIKKFSGLAA